VPYLGSRSTFVAGKLGGLHGEPLRINDTLPLSKIPPKMMNRKWPSELIPKMTNEWTILALAGPHGLGFYLLHFLFKCYDIDYKRHLYRLSDRRRFQKYMEYFFSSKP
jgi:allophanate hydrolase subunit 2